MPVNIVKIPQTFVGMHLYYLLTHWSWQDDAAVHDNNEEEIVLRNGKSEGQSQSWVNTVQKKLLVCLLPLTSSVKCWHVGKPLRHSEIHVCKPFKMSHLRVKIKLDLIAILSFKYLVLSTLSKFVFKCHISLDNQDISTLWFDQRGSQYYISPLLNAELFLSETCSWHIHQWMDRGKL